MNVRRLVRGDWLVGTTSAADNNRLLYAMRVSEVMTLKQYSTDERFAVKRPAKREGPPEKQCGDNIYYQNERGEWKRYPSHFHNDVSSCVKDVGKKPDGPPVFVSDHFYYFGRDRQPIHSDFHSIIRRTQGVHYIYDSLAEDFVTWLERSGCKPGIIGLPRDFEDHSHDSSPMITDWTARSVEQGKPLVCGPRMRLASKRPSQTPHC